MTATCTAAPSGLSFSSAPGKRQIERSTVPVSDGIFMPGIRPDSGSQSPNAGAGGLRVRQRRAPLSIAVFLPASPGTNAGFHFLDWS